MTIIVAGKLIIKPELRDEFITTLLSSSAKFNKPAVFND